MIKNVQDCINRIIYHMINLMPGPNDSCSLRIKIEKPEGVRQVEALLVGGQSCWTHMDGVYQNFGLLDGQSFLY